MYQTINPKIEKKIQNILEGDYEISVLGTNGKDNFPFLSKIIPMYKNNKLYLLISDLSEHTQNIALNHNVSIYFSLKELNKTKSNNPRLTINGLIKKHVLAHFMATPSKSPTTHVLHDFWLFQEEA